MRQTTIVTAEQIGEALRDALPGIVLLGAAHRIPQGYSSESWRVATDRGDLLVKVRRQQTDAAKLQSMVEAVRLVREAGVATPEILYAAYAPVVEDRPLVIARYLPGEDAESALPTLDDTQRQGFFADLGAAIGRIHTVALPAFTERIGTPEGGVDDWAVMVRQNAARYTAWAGSLGCLEPAELAAIESRLVAEAARVAPAVRPALTHRDLYPANFLIADGRFAAILDFELAKGRDPLGDFIKLGMLVFEPWPQSVAPLLASYRQIVGPAALALERLIVYHGLEQLTMIPNWRLTGEVRLEDYSRRQLRDWLAGRYPDWLVQVAALIAA